MTVDFTQHTPQQRVRRRDSGIAAGDEDMALQTRERLVRACDEMKTMLGKLSGAGNMDEEIHQIRKWGKSLRGGLALFRLEKTAGLEIQAIGRLLSSPRDARSRYHTWKKLDWANDPSLASAIECLLHQQMLTASAPTPAETIAWCIARVNAATAELGRLPRKELGARMVRGAVKMRHKALSRCRKLDIRSEKDFHNARKALKAWNGAINFLEQPPARQNPLLHELAERLGDENDLATLAQWLKGHGFTRHFASDLWRRISDERTAIRRRVLKDAENLRTMSKF